MQETHNRRGRIVSRRIDRKKILLDSFFRAFGLIQKHRINRFLLREVSRTFDSAFPARSKFTTFWHQKVAPKVSAGHLRRDRTAVLTERAQKTPLFCTPAPGARTAVRSDSSSGAMRKLWCAPRNDDLFTFQTFRYICCNQVGFI